MTKEEFSRLAARGPVLLDGATGSNLRAAGMPVGVSPEAWVLDHPEVLLDLQRGFVEAGSRIIRDGRDDFQCPLKTFSYEVQLINAGVTRFHFHSITITEITDGK